MNKSIFIMLLTILMSGPLYLSAQEKNNIINPDALTAQVQKAMGVQNNLTQSGASQLKPEFMALKLAAEKERARKLYGLKIIHIDVRKKKTPDEKKNALFCKHAKKILACATENARIEIERREEERRIKEKMTIENLMN